MNDDDASVLDELPEISTAASQTSDAGSYDIVLTGGNSELYNITLENGTLSIEKQVASISITGLEYMEDSQTKTPLISTDPADLAFNVTYNGSEQAPSIAGSYEVIVTIDETNYTGTATATMVISSILNAGAMEELKIYPNPATEYVRIKSGNLINYELRNLEGKLLKSGNSDERIDVRNLPEGMYIIQLIHDNSTVSSLPLIKK